MDKLAFFDRIRPLFGQISGSQVVAIDTLVNEGRTLATPPEALARQLAVTFLDDSKAPAFESALTDAGYLPTEKELPA